MYHYNIDNAVIYTPDDLALFRESPFAAWMERLTLENPEHGIPADLDTAAPADLPESQAGIAETLRAEGRQVAEIDREEDEAERRAATIAAMRDGADFIVDGQLAVDNLSGRVNLLMRTSGYSDLGDFLYVPCETEAGDRARIAFRLAFSADLLHSLQGTLPPQMLIIRQDADVVSLQTEDHIFYYRAVLQRFMHAMETFRKHRMPDPAESCHFGRWSECASEVLKQRARREQLEPETPVEEEQAEEELMEMPPLMVAAGAAQPAVDAVPGDMPDAVRADGGARAPEQGHTLAEQAQQFDPGRFNSGAPGRTPNLARFPAPENGASQAPAVEEEPAPETPAPEKRDSGESAGSANALPESGLPDRTSSESQGIGNPPADNLEPDWLPATPDAALENLEFIGRIGGIQGMPDDVFSADVPEDGAPPPAPNLRETAREESPRLDNLPLPEVEEIDTPLFLPPDASSQEEPSTGDEETSSLARRPPFDDPSMVDSDSAPAPTLVPDLKSEPETPQGDVLRRDFGFKRPDPAKDTGDGEARGDSSSRPFDDRLNTSQEFDD